MSDSTPDKPEILSIHSLSEETGSSRECIKKWLIDAGFDPLNLTVDRKADYISVIKSHQVKATKMPIRDGDGMTWLERKQKQEERKLKRENDIAERVMREEWVSSSAHFEIISAIFAEIEQVPDKFHAESGCSIVHKDKLRTMLDQSRNNASANIRQSFELAKKRVRESKA